MSIGFFDSGVGGLSVLREVKRLLPNLSTVYLADTAHFPYGSKTEEQVRQYTLNSVRILMKQQLPAVVVACNSASTSALLELRHEFPELPIVGAVPAIKPAAILTKSGLIAVLATERTLKSKAYLDLKNRFAGAVKVIDQACPGWVELVEAGHFDDEEADQAVEQVIAPLIKSGVDVFVLGCTHYPFLKPLITKHAGPAAKIVDAGPAVAQQLQRVLGKKLPRSKEADKYYCTGPADEFSRVASLVMNEKIVAEHVDPLD